MTAITLSLIVILNLDGKFLSNREFKACTNVHTNLRITAAIF